MAGNEPRKFFGVEVPADERTPLVDRLLRVIEEQRAEIGGLRAEIARLKGLPPRPQIRPSTLNQPHPDPSRKKRRRGKRPGSAKRSKTRELTIHETVPLPVEGLPEGTLAEGYREFVVHRLGRMRRRGGVENLGVGLWRTVRDATMADHACFLRETGCFLQKATSLGETGLFSKPNSPLLSPRLCYPSLNEADRVVFRPKTCIIWKVLASSRVRCTSRKSFKRKEFLSAVSPGVARQVNGCRSGGWGFESPRPR